VTTDVIVGFPGETEEHYLETRKLFEDLRFDNAYVFRYSKRRGTPAAEMEDALQVPERVKEQRNQDLLALVNSIALPMYDALVGQEVEILCEGPSKTNAERLTGRTGTNRIVVFDGNPQRHTGELFNVRITEAGHFTLFGDAVLTT
jgi:tRNA-2-methylthio-N6-dimethylallyladenosine synthase